MSTALAVQDRNTAITQPIEYSREQLDLIKDTYAKGASDAEFTLFVETAKYRGLDIMKRQICLIGYWDSKASKNIFQPVVTIEGQRSKAEASGLYRGQTMPMWCGRDGKWVDVWLEDGPPAAAKIGVYREGFAEPIWAVARFDSYAAKKDGKPIAMWAKMPDVMIAKCAESLALRKAFPEVLGGIYSDVEMEQARNEKNVTPSADATISHRDQYLATLEYLWTLGGKTAEEWPAFVVDNKLNTIPEKTLTVWIEKFTERVKGKLQEDVHAQRRELISDHGISAEEIDEILGNLAKGVFVIEQMDYETLRQVREDLGQYLDKLRTKAAA